MRTRTVAMLASLAIVAVGATAAYAQQAPREARIELNQLGYLPASAKRATVPAVAAPRFQLVDAETGRAAWTGALGPAASWAPAKRRVRIADFSALTRPGTYRLRVAGLPDSDPFTIGASRYDALAAGAIRAFYFNRAGIALTPELAGPYARPAGHPDTRVLIHASAAGPKRQAGDVIGSPKGWYDAGDYNKYVVNSGISVYTLLAAYEQMPERLRALKVGLPESGDGLPDVLNEALWNLDWMLTMQDPDDGGVYHKLTNPSFDGVVMPDAATASGDRVVVQKSTAATLDFAAVMAVGSRVFKDFEQQRPGLSARMLAAARSAWTWAQAHPDAIYRQPPDIHTGDYGDATLDDEFAWAAAELYIATGDDAFHAAMQPARTAMTVPSWGDVRGLAWMSLATHRERLTPAADRALIERRLRGLADALVAKGKASAWGVALDAKDFGWGSNSTALNEAMVLLQADRLDTARPGARPSAPRPYRQAAQALFDYVLGRNPLGMSMVTGFGARSPMHPHHRPSEADGVDAPVPGFLVGGANAGQQDLKGCPVPYPSGVPALSYLDHFCSYASNEVAINWNAPLVYVSVALGR
ncbi:glycoside hydrolase family 9 protein [Mitsuaria sp. GD03876]|uniref:glycoside hydrolase family 9 protein n=1 Tax=Mitsuaria sp. GD03876 TaxID=2975399 RepID=UPI002447F4AF|nr:glycoside hydrolase family 9 protein [Mitsuaria sp. GD03876]MDH0867221.1 glycoside hydrolase family 9 protein [Mitsuaria sp. GD03876]